MDKINKNDIRKIKKVLKVSVIFGVGCYVGSRLRCLEFNRTIEHMRKTGKTISNIIDGEEYILQVVKK